MAAGPLWDGFSDGGRDGDPGGYVRQLGLGEGQPHEARASDGLCLESGFAQSPLQPPLFPQ